MTHNDLRKGDKVWLRGGRFATMCDSRRGIHRRVKVVERDGWHGDMGDVYVWDIVAKLPADTDLETAKQFDSGDLEFLTLTPAHEKKRRTIRMWGF